MPRALTYSGDVPHELQSEMAASIGLSIVNSRGDQANDRALAKQDLNLRKDFSRGHGLLRAQQRMGALFPSSIGDIVAIPEVDCAHHIQIYGAKSSEIAAGAAERLPRLHSLDWTNNRKEWKDACGVISSLNGGHHMPIVIE